MKQKGNEINILNCFGFKYKTYLTDKQLVWDQHAGFPFRAKEVLRSNIPLLCWKQTSNIECEDNFGDRQPKETSHKN